MAIKLTMETKTRYYFNMPEIIIAMLVSIMGMTAVSGLMSTSLDATSRAVNAGVGFDSAAQFLKFNIDKIDENSRWATIFPDERPNGQEPNLAGGWSSEALFATEGMTVTPDLGFDKCGANNSGFFILRQLQAGVNGTTHNEFSAIIRMWKEVTELSNGGITIELFCEISWNLAAAYDSPGRKKKFLRMEVYNPDTLPSIGDCTEVRENGGGYFTMLENVTANGNGSYTVSLGIYHRGCGLPECIDINAVYVEASPGNYISGNMSGANGTFSEFIDADDPIHHGFKLIDLSDINSGEERLFSIDYSVDTLQARRIAITDSDGGVYSANFSASAFNAVRGCN